MKKFITATMLSLAMLSANAQVIGSLGGLSDSTNFLDLSTAVGGTTYLNNALPNAAIPVGTYGTWLAAGPGNNGDSILALPNNTKYVSFLWGSPDPEGWNTLFVNTNAGISVFSAASLGIPTNGAQNLAQYVNFVPTGAATKIVSLGFTSNQNAFEVANITAVPEPTSVALMLAGLVGIGIARRKQI